MILVPLGSYLRTRGIRDGIFGGRRGWLAIGLVMWSGRLVKKMVSRSSELVAVENLEPGQSITVSALASEESARRRRRRA
ncbi:MAG: hypothetical protein ACO3SP_02975 [Ilumatobacteraceae bacterium]